MLIVSVCVEMDPVCQSVWLDRSKLCLSVCAVSVWMLSVFWTLDPVCPGFVCLYLVCPPPSGLLKPSLSGHSSPNLVCTDSDLIRLNLFWTPSGPFLRGPCWSGTFLDFRFFQYLVWTLSAPTILTLDPVWTFDLKREYVCVYIYSLCTQEERERESASVSPVCAEREREYILFIWKEIVYMDNM